jgi:hypothetical protein
VNPVPGGGERERSLTPQAVVMTEPEVTVAGEMKPRQKSQNKTKKRKMKENIMTLIIFSARIV